MKPLTVLSMGWGVQTWTLAAMMALDEHPRPDYIIFADTHHESQGTYDFVQAWTPWLGEHGLNVVTVEGKRTEVVMPWSTSVSVMIPAFTVDAATGKHGQVRRQCTHDWKISPIRRFVRATLASQGVKIAPNVAECWMGISLDEYQRMRDSDAKYITNCYPLVDLRMTRRDCIIWLAQHDLPAPPKSACTFCPYKSMGAWKELKRQGGPDWQEAVDVDAVIREKRSEQHGLLYVHPTRRPLPEAVSIPEDEGAYQVEMDIGCEGGYCMV